MLENDTQWLARDAVLHRNLWEFITGAEVIHLYQVLFTLARCSQSPLHVPFRCNSPDLRRHRCLDIVPRDGDALELAGTLLKIEPRATTSLGSPR